MNKENKKVIIEHVYSDLRKQIILGNLKDGEKLSEINLAEKYNVSRLHIREALKQLEFEFLADYAPRKGYRVKSITRETLEEIALIRYVFDCEIFKYFSKHATEDDIMYLNRKLQRMRIFGENEMLEDFIDELNDYYSYIYDRCPYKRMISILNTYSDYIYVIKLINKDSNVFYQIGLLNMEKLTESLANRNEKEIENALYSRTETIFNHPDNV